jgi:hypothetical protein
VIEIPELGVRFGDLPAVVADQRPAERPAGYEWRAIVGVTSLSILREEQPVPQGSDISDETYRGSILKPGAGGAASTLGSHAAWTVTETRRAGPATIEVRDWFGYVIVDQHLYRLTVSTIIPPGKKSDFDTLVTAMSDISFHPVQRATAPPPPKPGEMPRFVSSGHQEYYPPRAKRLGEHGVVGVVFTIDGQGHARDIHQLYADVPDLVPASAAVLQDGVFRVPADWEETASDKQRFYIEFQFLIAQAGAGCPSLDPREPSAKVVTICAHQSIPFH